MLPKEQKNAIPWTYAISDLHGEEIVGAYEKELKNTSWKEFMIEKVIKKKDNRPYGK